MTARAGGLHSPVGERMPESISAASAASFSVSAASSVSTRGCAGVAVATGFEATGGVGGPAPAGVAEAAGGAAADGVVTARGGIALAR